MFCALRLLIAPGHITKLFLRNTTMFQDISPPWITKWYFWGGKTNKYVQLQRYHSNFIDSVVNASWGHIKRLKRMLLRNFKVSGSYRWNDNIIFSSKESSKGANHSPSIWWIENNLVQYHQSRLSKTSGQWSWYGYILSGSR